MTVFKTTPDSAEVKDRLDETSVRAIYHEIIGAENVKRAGEDWLKCKNPLKSGPDRNPSFNFHRENGAWRDHRTGDSGSVFDAVMQKTGCDFADAVRIVAQYVGMRSESPAAKPTSNGQVRPRIIATYDYVDEGGQLLSQAVRLEPKGFYQRQPNGKGDWINSLEGVRRVPYRLPSIINSNGRTPIYIVEGEQDADRLADAGLISTCNAGGAGNWSEGLETYLFDRHVVVIPDNDVAGHKHAQDVARRCSAVAKSVKVLKLPDLPEKGDISDWLDAGGTVAEFRRLTREAPAWEPSTEPEEAADSSTREIKRSIISAMALHGRTRPFADALTADHFFASDPGGTLYVYQDGVYRPTGRQFIAGELRRRMEGWDISNKWSKNRVAEVTAYIEADIPTVWERPPAHEVNVANGILDINTGEIRPHNPEYLSTIQIPVMHEPEATCPNWERFIEQTFPEDTQQLAFEVVADVMTTARNDQRAILLVGDGNNGKSRYLTGIRAFLGRGNYHTASLHQLGENRFALAQLYGKLANICPDIPSDHLTDTSVFKALTGNDELTAERKHKDPFSFIPFVRLVFSANSLPRSNDSSSGFFRRWLVVPFHNSFEGSYAIAPALIDEMLSDPGELSGVLNRALEHAGDLIYDGFTTSASTDEAWSEFRDVTDPLTGWIEAHLSFQPMEVIHRRDVYSAWSRYCGGEGLAPGTPNAFYRRIRDVFAKVEEQRTQIDGRRDRAFVGLRLSK